MNELTGYEWSAIIVPIIVAILSPIIQGAVTNAGTKKKLGRQWKCKYKDSAFNYYYKCLVFLLLMIVVSPIVSCFSLAIFIEADSLIRWAQWEGLTIYIIAVISIAIVDFKRHIFITKQGNKYIGRIIMGMTMIGCLTIYWLSVIQSEDTRFIGIPFVGIIALEVLGIFVFDDKITYQYKRARVTLDDNITVLDVESDAISIKDKWLIVLVKNGSRAKEVRIYQDKISKIEYYDKQY